MVLAENAYLADPHIRVGLPPADGGAILWPLAIGLVRAKEYLMLGSKVGAEEALRIGLVNRVVPAKEVVDEARRIAERLASLPTRALRDTKRMLNHAVRQAALAVLDFGLAAEGGKAKAARSSARSLTLC